jgi:hypothetical protein
MDQRSTEGQFWMGNPVNYVTSKFELTDTRGEKNFVQKRIGAFDDFAVLRFCLEYEHLW